MLTYTVRGRPSVGLRVIVDQARKRMMETVGKSGLLVVGQAKRNVKERFTVRHGQSGLLGITMIRRPQRLEVAVGPRVVYGRIHEFGGIIRPKNAKYLSIPVGDLKGSPRKHPGLWFLRVKGKLLMLDDAKRIQYVLVKSVKIPARPYLSPALKSETPAIEKLFAEAGLKLFLQAKKASE